MLLQTIRQYDPAIQNIIEQFISFGHKATQGQQRPMRVLLKTFKAGKISAENFVSWATIWMQRVAEHVSEPLSSQELAGIAHSLELSESMTKKANALKDYEQLKNVILKMSTSRKLEREIRSLCNNLQVIIRSNLLDEDKAIEAKAFHAQMTASKPGNKPQASHLVQGLETQAA